MASVVSSVSSSSDSECKEPTEQDSSVSTTSTDKPVASEDKLEIKNQQMRNKPEEDEEEDDDSDGGVNSTQPNDDDDKTLQGVNICSPMGKPSLVQSRVLIRPSAFKFGSSTTASTPSFTASTNNFVLRPAKLIPSSSVKAPPPAATPSSPERTTPPTPQFMPLEKDENASTEEKIEVPQATQEESNANPNFVFGSNLSERVNIPEGGVVAAAGQKRKIANEDDDEEHVKKPSVEEVPLGVTGEEHEVNAMQLHCKLFIFDGVNSSWIERGRGLLRLNDSKEDTDVSRLIIRSKGSLRVMLNTKVWEGMRVEKVNDKGIRLMAVDLEANSETDNTSEENTTTNALRIFLIMTTSISDTYALTAALDSRVAKAASRTSSDNNT